jgi:hypothetical protein
VRKHSLGRYDDALKALTQKGIWKSLERFAMKDARQDTAPHVVMFEEVTDDPVARFREVERFFYRLPSPH